MEVFFQKSLGMGLSTTQFSNVKDALRFDSTSKTVFSGGPHNLLLSGTPHPVGSYHGWGNSPNPSTFFMSIGLMGNPNILDTSRMCAHWSLPSPSPVIVLPLHLEKKPANLLCKQIANYGIIFHPPLLNLSQHLT